MGRSPFGLLEIRLISAADEENTDARKFPWLLRVSITPTVTSTATTRIDKRADFFIAHLDRRADLSRTQKM
jgi:hypothetical protein